MYYVYVDYATRGEKKDKPYYVGMGNEQRVAGKSRNNEHFDTAIEHGWRREVVFITEFKDEALVKEAHLIRTLGTLRTPENMFGTNLVINNDDFLIKRVDMRMQLTTPHPCHGCKKTLLSPRRKWCRKCDNDYDPRGRFIEGSGI